MRVAVLLSFLVVPASSLAADVVINEFQSNPDGTDGDHEWVELFNVSGASVDLSGWKVERATQPGGYATVFEVPASTSIAPGQHLVLAGSMADVPVGSLFLTQSNDMGNAASTNSDGLRLVNGLGAVIDVVIYGGANATGQVFVDESGFDVLDPRLAPHPGSGESSGRLPDGEDNDDGTDFVVFSTPTPGAANDAVDTDDTDVPVTCPTPGAVVINELSTNPDGTDGDAEWVELVVTGSSAVDVSEWTVRAALSPGSFSTAFTVPASTTLSPGEFLVLAGNSAVDMPLDAVVQTQQATFGNATSSSDAAGLYDAEGCLIDLVVYGTANDPLQIFKDEAGADVPDANLAPAGPSGGSLGRYPDATDTNVGSADFVSYATPSPGAANPMGGTNPGGGDCRASVGLVINELVVDAEGTDDDAEWVEIGNPTSGSVDIGGWMVQAATSPGNWSTAFTVPLGVQIPAGGHLAVGGLSSGLTDGPSVELVEQGTSFGNATSSSDAARLVDASGCVADIVVYGAQNDTTERDTDTDGGEVEVTFLDEDGVPVRNSRLAPKPGSGESLARVIDLEDTNDNAQDFVVAGEPTPGEANPDLSCKAVKGDIVINEFRANPAGTDSTAGTEFVELYNAGDADLDVSGWTIRERGTTVESVTYTFRPGSVVPAGGFRVAGGPFAEALDDLVQDMDLGSGSSGDLVLLYDCEGERADAILYGGENKDELEDDNGLTPDKGAPKPPDDRCLGRRPDGEDTNVSLDDITLLPACTPGESNGEPSTTGGGGNGPDGPTGCGCGGGPTDPGSPGIDSPEGREPGEGCATVPSGRLGVLLGLGVLVGLRRRRG